MALTKLQASGVQTSDWSPEGCSASTSLGVTASGAAALFARQRSSDEIASAIANTTVKTVLRSSASPPRAIVAAGSLARGEATILFCGDDVRILGDAEFYVLFDAARDAAAFRANANEIAESIERVLKGEGIVCPVSFGVPTAEIWRRTRPNFVNYDLRTTGRVLWGDQAALNLIPPFSAEALPRWDSWRSLANRIIEQLAAADLCWEDDQNIRDLLYRCMKLQLEAVSTVLHFLGAYAPSYKSRIQVLDQLVRERTVPLTCAGELLSAAQRYTNFKLNPNSPSCYRQIFAGAIGEEDRRLVRAEVLATVKLIEEVWKWAAKQMLRASELPDDIIAVGLAIAARQDWKWRVRGWAQLAIVDRQLFSATYYRRIFRLFRYGGPRFLTYAVAAALYFSWPNRLSGDEGAAEQAALRGRRFLPFDCSAQDTDAWTEMRQSVVHDWERFLKPNWA